MTATVSLTPPAAPRGARGAKIAKHSGILMLMELGIRVLDALVSIVLARYLAPEGFGLLAFALSYANLFSILPGFGMGSFAMRDVAQDPKQLGRYLSNGLLAKGLLTVGTLALIWLVTVIGRFGPEKQHIVLLAGGLMICETIVRFVLSFFQAVQRMTTVAVTNVLVRVGWLAGSIIVMLMRGGVADLVTVRLAVTAVGVVVSVVLVQWRLEHTRWTFEPRFMWHILVASFPFALFRLFGQVYTDIDTVMLSSMRGDTLTGLYAAGQKILRIFGFIQSGFFNAILPALSKFSKDSQQDLGRAMGRSCRYLIMIAMPIAAGICVLADQIVLLFYGKEYAGAIPAMRILIWSLVFTFLNSAMVAAIASVRKEAKASKYLLAGCLFSGLSNLAVIPLWGHLGAATTSVLAEAFVFALQSRLLARTVPHMDVVSEFRRPLLATAAMAAVTWLLHGFGLIVAVGGSSLVYVGCLFAMGLIGPEERAIAVQLFRFRPAGQGA